MKADETGRRRSARTAGGTTLAALASAALCAACVAPAQTQAQAQTQTPGGERPRGYIDPSFALDDSVVLPPPPADDSSRGVADHEAFLATRALEGSERWSLAAIDAATDRDSQLDAFSCALGVRLERERLPETGRLLARATADVGPLVGAAKNRHDRTRPFVAMSGPVCTDSSYLADNGSYPSGHTAVGWIYALTLTQLAPDRASEILARGRVYGESRVVCGAHYPSDVEGGRLAATAVFGLLQSSPDYRADLERARAELQGWRAEAAAPDPARCAVEREAASSATW